MGRYMPTLQQELDDPFNEWGTWDYEPDQCDFDEDTGYPEDTPDWWHIQDEELRAEELERIEAMADAEELRHNGYWD